MRTGLWSGAAALAFILAGCGETTEQQALFGTGAGAATAVILDGSPFTGAVLGAAGNLVYCQTQPDKCN